MWQDGIVENILSSPFHAQTGVSAYLAVFWSNSSHHWLSSVFLTGTPTGGSHTHSPVLRLANMCSCNWDDQIRIIFYFILLDSHVLWFSRHMLQSSPDYCDLWPPYWLMFDIVPINTNRKYPNKQEGGQTLSQLNWELQPQHVRDCSHITYSAQVEPDKMKIDSSSQPHSGPAD